MKKKFIKIFLILWLFFSFILNSFALDIKLQTDKQQVNINDTFNLILKIKSSGWGLIKIKSIKWIEKFKILWQSQSQNSSTDIEVINWKTQKKAVTIINFDLILKPLKNWEFEIGPAILQDGSWTIETNKVNIKVSWNKSILLNWWNIKTNNLQNSNTTLPQNHLLKGEGKQKSLSPIRGELEGSSQNNYELYLLLAILLVSGIGFYFLYQNKDKLNINNEIKKEDFQNKEKEEIDFEEKKQVEIIYPDAEEENFEEKIDRVFRQKLQNTYNIKNIDSLTFEEIKEFIDKDKIGDFEEIISNLNKIKYSNIIWDKTKVIELIKEF